MHGRRLSRARSFIPPRSHPAPDDPTAGAASDGGRARAARGVCEHRRLAVPRPASCSAAAQARAVERPALAAGARAPVDAPSRHTRTAPRPRAACSCTARSTPPSHPRPVYRSARPSSSTVASLPSRRSRPPRQSSESSCGRSTTPPTPLSALHRRATPRTSERRREARPLTLTRPPTAGRCGRWRTRCGVGWCRCYGMPRRRRPHAPSSCACCLSSTHRRSPSSRRTTPRCALGLALGASLLTLFRTLGLTPGLAISQVGGGADGSDGGSSSETLRHTAELWRSYLDAMYAVPCFYRLPPSPPTYELLLSHS